MIRRISFCVYGNASVEVFPEGVHQPWHNFYLPASSTLGGIGWGIRLYYGRVLISQELMRYHRLSVPETDSIVFINSSPGGLQLSVGYSVFESGGFRLAPVIDGGVIGFATTKASPNPFLYIGGSLDASYNYQLPIYLPPRIIQNGDKITATPFIMIALRCGYAQNFSGITGQATHPTLFARLNIGVGIESLYIPNPEPEEQ